MAAIEEFLDEHPNVYVGDPHKCKRLVEAMLWIGRSGAQGRFLPQSYGQWNSVYKRFNRWAKAGVWEGMLRYFAQDSDMEAIMRDATFIPAQACAAGGKGETSLSI